jgi:hypothetical protein
MGVGTGGTLLGVGRALHKANVPARVVAVEPDGSAVMSGDAPGRHGIQGLADVIIPDLIKLDEIDQIVRISTADRQHILDAHAGSQKTLVRIAQYDLGYAERIYVSHSMNRSCPSVSPDACCDGGQSLQLWQQSLLHCSVTRPPAEIASRHAASE